MFVRTRGNIPEQRLIDLGCRSDMLGNYAGRVRKSDGILVDQFIAVE